MRGAILEFLDETQIFPLSGGRRIELHAAGVLHPRSLTFGGEVFTAYADITHLAPAGGALRMGTLHGVFVFWRSRFAEAGAIERLARALLERVASGPEGDERMARMAAVEELARDPRTNRIGLFVALWCAVVAGLGVLLGPMVTDVGLFHRSVAAIEPWRFVTANFLHSGPLHLFVNGLGLLILCPLVERPFGVARTVMVLGAAGLGAMGACHLLSGGGLGASGLIAGLAGALLWLELRAPERLPAAWRVPRRFFLAVLILQVILDQILPFVSASGHAGGFLAGYGAAAVVGRGRSAFRDSSKRLRFAATGVVALCVLAVVFAAYPWVLGGEALTARARGLLVGGRHPELQNAYAWTIVTRAEPSRSQVRVALDLAEAAVDGTGRRSPEVLDTLAEVLFVLGRTDDALAAIAEAVSLAPEEAYFREQRRRFLGEREFDDRPDPPGPRLPAPLGEDPLPFPADPGVRV